MARGLDTNVDCTPHAACLKQAGFDFVGRYYKFVMGSQPLTRAEALALSQAGLFIVAIYENGYPTAAPYFSHVQGLEDGKRAYDYARNKIGQPEGSAIYFTVDYDASPGDLEGRISEYFGGIAEAFDAASGGQPAYPIGVYGSGCVCAWLIKHTSVTYTWLAMARDWCGSRTFTGWNLRQSGSSQSLCGLAVDLDESNGHGGGFKVKGSI